MGTMKLAFIVLHSLLFIIHTSQNLGKSTVVFFEDTESLLGYSYMVTEDAKTGYKTLARDEQMIYCSNGKVILQEQHKVLAALKACLKKVLDFEQAKGSAAGDIVEPTSIKYIISNSIQYEKDYDEEIVTKNQKALAQSFSEETTIDYDFKLIMLDSLKTAFLTYATNNIDAAKNDFFNRPIVSLTPSHLVIVFETLKREEKARENSLSDNILYPDRLNLATRSSNCLGAKQFYQIYLTSLILEQINDSHTIDPCSSMDEFEYEFEKELSQKCYDYSLLDKMPKKIKIVGVFDVEKCKARVVSLLEIYSISSLSVKQELPEDGIFDDIAKIGKPTNKEFIAMSMFSAYTFSGLDAATKLTHIQDRCLDQTGNKFDIPFYSNDEKCFALVYSATFLEMFTSKLGFTYEYHDQPNDWVSGAMFIDPSMTTDTRQHVKWIVAIVLLTIIALISVTTLIIILTLEKHKSSRMNSAASNGVFLWNFPPK